MLSEHVFLKRQAEQIGKGVVTMKNFSFNTRLIYFGAIVLFSLGFFLLQLSSVMDGSTGIGSIILLILWGVMAAFGIGGIIASFAVKKRSNK